MLKMPTLDVHETPAQAVATETKVFAQDVNVYYGEKHALKNVSIDVPDRAVTGLHRPVGLRQVHLPALHQPHERHDRELRVSPARSSSTARTSTIQRIDVVQLRARVGMVFQKPNPFPKSIYENVAYGPRIHGLAARKEDLDEIVAGEPRARRACGTRSRTACTSPAPASPAASSSGSASRAPSRSTPKSS